MIAIGNTLVSEEIFEKKFVCDLNACKGACCVLGDAGAPLEESEIPILEDLLDDVMPFLSEEGRKALEEQGAFVVEQDGSFTTPLIQGKECAFTTFTDKGIALCGIEQAYIAGVVDWKKPISCELYPIRISKIHAGEAVNYHKWDICAPACKCGKELEVPVFKFLKKAIVRKFDAEYFQELEIAATYLASKALK